MGTAEEVAGVSAWSGLRAQGSRDASSPWASGGSALSLGWDLTVRPGGWNRASRSLLLDVCPPGASSRMTCQGLDA